MNKYDEIIQKVSMELYKTNLVTGEMLFDTQSFAKSKRRLAEMNWKVPSTTITPIMERLLYSFGQDSSYENIVCLGSYYGYAMVWMLLSNYQKSGRYYGYDIDYNASKNAINNFNKLFNSPDNINIQPIDALNGYNDFKDEEVDILFIDVEINGSKRLYKKLLNTWYSKLADKALVLAHDPIVPKFKSDFNEYFTVTGNRGMFMNEIVLPVDECGLHIAKVKKGREQ